MSISKNVMMIGSISRFLFDGILVCLLFRISLPYIADYAIP